MNRETGRRRAWCNFRNLVHTTYREVRHVGTEDDAQARLRLPSTHRFFEAAEHCQAKRDLLKGTSLFRQTAAAESVDAVIRPYHDATGLKLPDLVSLFNENGWAHSYGGRKWAAIASVALELAEALSEDNLDAALSVCAFIQDIEHNSGRLVPSREDWSSTPYLREKWPELCD